MVTVTTNPEKAEKRNIFFTGNVVSKDTMTLLVTSEGDNNFIGVVLENKLPFAEERTGKLLQVSKNNCHQFYGTVIIESL